MNLKILPKSSLTDWIKKLAKDYRLIGPTRTNGSHSFTEIKDAQELDLGYRTSTLPPKKALLPQQEDLIRFDRQEGQISSIFDFYPTVLLGIHTCDLYGIELLDQVFSQGIVDHHYLTRREAVTLVSIECLSVCSDHAFCKDMGTLSLPEKFDLHLTDIGDAFIIQLGSEKGAKLVEGFQNVQLSDSASDEKYHRVLSKKWANFFYRLNVEISAVPSLIRVSANSTLWEEIAKQCLGCGTCTLVCPTCYCFDILDEADFTLGSGRRYRVWDSCQLNQFASVAGGHDFRPTRAARQRHRFRRKYSYQSIGPGLLACVGCGRCATNCLVRIDPVDVINKLNQHRVAAKHTQREVVK